MASSERPAGAHNGEAWSPSHEPLNPQHQPPQYHVPFHGDQPGLEVNHTTGLIPVNATPDKYPSVYEVSQQQPYKTYDEYAAATEAEKATAYADAAAARQKAKRMMWVAVGVGILAVVVVAAVLGGVLGSRPASGSSSQSDTSTTTTTGGGTSNSSAGPASTMIRARSPLTTTGNIYGTDYSIVLFFQAPDDGMKYMIYQTNFDAWSEPRDAHGSTAPMGGSPIAASTILIDALDKNLPPIHQTEFWFITKQNLLVGHNWRDGGTLAGLEDQSTSERISMPANTKMAAYWPTVMFQDGAGAVRETWFRYITTSEWEQATVLPNFVAPGSPLVVLPREARYSAGLNVSSSGVLVAFRAANDGTLMLYDRFRNGTAPPPGRFGLPQITLDEDAALAGFATGRPGTTNDINVHFLYQNRDGIINFVYRNSGTNTWIGPATDKVFEGADKPTNLACVTAASHGDPNIPLASTYDISRCFFQVGKALKQVRFDGSKWTDLGFVPIP